jgi:DNA repair protein RadC
MMINKKNTEKTPIQKSLKWRNDWFVEELQVSYTRPKSEFKLCDVETAAEYLNEIWDKELLELQETFYCLFLDISQRLIAWRCISVGTSRECCIDVKLLMQLALKCNAQKIILAHNHPSGSIKPSDADMQCTKTILDACNLFGIELLDHIIITKERYYSFASNDMVIPQDGRKRYKLSDPGESKK